MRTLLTAATTIGLALAAILGAGDIAPQAAPQSQSKPRILVFTKTATFRHPSIPDGVKCVTELLTPTAEVVHTEDSAQFTTENLKQFRAVVFLSTTGDVLNESQQTAFANYIETGGGFAGIHAASDTEHEWPWFAKMIGSHFAGHPDIQLATVVVEDKSHPSTAMLPERWPRTDEWYRFKRNPRTVDGIHILAALDESTFAGGGMNGDHPCAWWRNMKAGRSWYTAGGHTKESFCEPLFREHLNQGIRWAARLESSPQEK
ncbi:MAG: ThuA domain-containing protein [Phycisphaerales bacterium]|nr:ThuA domain-containing protein [Phycisphaerales bacterium]